MDYDSSSVVEYLESIYPEPEHVEVCDYYPRYAGHWIKEGEFYRYVIDKTWLEWGCY